MSLAVGRAENFFSNPSVEITLYGYMDSQENTKFHDILLRV